MIKIKKGFLISPLTPKGEYWKNTCNNWPFTSLYGLQNNWPSTSVYGLKNFMLVHVSLDNIFI